MELSDDEMSKLITAIIVRRAQHNKQEDVLGNLYILKFFNTKEDVREISTLINACARLGYTDIAISYCLENEKAKTQALDIYTKYKQELVSGLRIAEKMDKIKGKGFVILNAKDQIKDAIVGTICSMLSSSPTYNEGTILIGMAYTMQQDAHVRVDIFYAQFSKPVKAWVDLFGAVFLLLPFMLFISWISWQYVANSWSVLEGSREAGGLPGVFLLKSLIPVMAFLLSLQAFTQIARNIETILNPDATDLKGDG